MLYLIGGTSRSGKSVISRRLLAAKGIPYLPLDSVVMGFTNGMPECGIHDRLFPDEIAKRMGKFVKALCESLIFAGDDYTVEGEALLPENVRELVNKHGDKITACFLGYCETTAEQKVREIKTCNVNPDDWLVKESDAYINDHIVNMIEYSKFIREECRTHKSRYFDVSRDFNATIEEVVSYLLRAG